MSSECGHENGCELAAGRGCDHGKITLCLQEDPEQCVSARPPSWPWIFRDSLSSAVLNRLTVSCPPSFGPESSSGPTNRVHPLGSPPGEVLKAPRWWDVAFTSQLQCCPLASTPHQLLLAYSQTLFYYLKKHLLPGPITAALTDRITWACMQGLARTKPCGKMCSGSLWLWLEAGPCLGTQNYPFTMVHLPNFLHRVSASSPPRDRQHGFSQVPEPGYRQHTFGSLQSSHRIPRLSFLRCTGASSVRSSQAYLCLLPSPPVPFPPQTGDAYFISNGPWRSEGGRLIYQRHNYTVKIVSIYLCIVDSEGCPPIPLVNHIYLKSLNA